MSKKFWTIIIILVIVFFFPKPFTSSPGFVTPEAMADFEANKKECAGFETLTNAAEMAADAPGKSLCFGWLHSPKKAEASDISGTWIHVQEEDEVGKPTIYRNSKSYDPPPTRFRHKFTYNDGGTCQSLQLAPNDAHFMKDVPCSFKIESGEGKLTLQGQSYWVERIGDQLLLSPIPIE